MTHRIMDSLRNPDEGLIPPCVADFRAGQPPASTNNIQVEVIDGGVRYTCEGNADSECDGFDVCVGAEPSDSRFPVLTEAMGAKCTARFMFDRKGSVLHRVEIID